LAWTSEALYRALAYALLLIAALILQTTILHFSPLEIVDLDLALVIVVWAGFSRGPNVGMLMGFVAGLAEDSLSGCSLGTNALAKTLVGGFAGAAGKVILPNSPIAHLIALSLGSLLNYSLCLLLELAFGTTRFNVANYAMHATAGTLAAVVVGMLLFRLFAKSKLLKPPRVPEEVV